MKILYISADYAPNSSPGAIRACEVAEQLPKHGVTPIVIARQTCIETGRSSWQLVGSSEVEWSNRRNRSATRANSGISKWFEDRIRNIFTLMDNDYHLNGQLVTLALNLCRDHEIELILVSCNPVSSAVAACELKKRTGLPLVIEFRDPWMDNPFRIWQTWLHFIIERYLERSAYEAADHIIFNTSYAAELVCQRYPKLMKSKVSVLPHFWSRKRFAKCDSHLTPCSKTRFIVGVGGGSYQGIRRDGNLVRWMTDLVKYAPKRKLAVDSERSSLRPFFDALFDLYREYPEEREWLEVHFLRSLRPEDEAYVARRGLSDCISTLGGVAADQVPEALSRFDCLYLNNIVFQKGQESPFVASRTFDYLASGKPIIAHLPPGEGRNLVERSGMAIIADPYEPNSILRALVGLIRSRRSGSSLIARDGTFVESLEATNRIRELIVILRATSNSSQGAR